MKKLISLFIALVFVITAFPLGVIPAFAESLEETVIYVDSVHTLTTGGTVTVDVKIENNPGIIAGGLTVSFEEGLTLTGATNGEAFSELTFTSTGDLSSPAKFAWDADAVKEIKDGTILSLSFEVAEGFESYTYLGIGLSLGNEDFADDSLSAVEVTLKDGNVCVIDYVPGDVNGDGLVSVLDLIILRRHIVGGYDVQANTLAADVNEDEKVNATDVAFIRRYLAGGYDIKLLPAPKPCEHIITYVEAVAPTCVAEGNVEYWSCTECGKAWADEACNEKIAVESTVISATGHNNVTTVSAKEPTYDEPGNISYWHCSDCNRYFNDEALTNRIEFTDTVIPAKTKYAINYHLYDNIIYLASNGVKNTNQAWYDPDHELKLTNLTAEGFIFDGWYDGPSDSATRLTVIPAGSTGDYELYAHWTPIQYDITFYHWNKGTDVIYEEAKYTIEGKPVASSKEWQGLKFNGWVVTDWTLPNGTKNTVEIGKTISKIPEGSTGKIELTAEWKVFRNIATKRENPVLLKEYDPSTGTYCFLYDLGTIEHVVIDSISKENSTNTKYNTGAADIELSFEESDTITKEFAKTISAISSHSATSSDDWSKVYNWADTESDSSSKGGKFGAEAAVKSIFSINAEFNIEKTDGSSHTTGGETITSGSLGKETSITEEYSTSIDFITSKSHTAQEKITISKDQPQGYYSYVRTSNVKVYALIVYDPVTDNIQLETYSILDNIHDAVLYYPDEHSMNYPTIEALDFDIPTDEISAYLGNAYYVEYDANGGEGEMNNTIHSFGENTILSPNKYTKVGYDFGGWIYNGLLYPANNNEPITVNGSLLSEPQKTENDDVSVHQEIIKVSAKWEPKTPEVTLHLNGGTIDGSDKLTVVYDDEYGSLPTPYLKGHKFNGWKLNGKFIDPATEIVKIENDHQLDADYTAITYTVPLDINSSSIKLATSINNNSAKITFGSKNVQLPIPTISTNKEGTAYYKFVGWYSNNGDKITGSDGIVAVWNYDDVDVTTLYAHYEQSYDSVYISNVAELKSIQNGYNYMLISSLYNIGNWTPISSYNGTFDGQGFTLSGMTYSLSNGINAELGMFKTLGSNAIVKNIRFDNCTITYAPTSEGNGVSKVKFGFIATFNYGKIESCTLTNTTINIDGNTKVSDQFVYVGNIACENYGTISYCTVDTGNINIDSDTVSSDSADDKCAVAVAGGICAYNKSSGTVTGCAIVKSSITTRVCYIADEGEDVKAVSGGIIAFQNGTQSGNSSSLKSLSAIKRYYKAKWSIFGKFKGTEYKGQENGDTGNIYARTGE